MLLSHQHESGILFYCCTLNLILCRAAATDVFRSIPFPKSPKNQCDNSEIIKLFDLLW